MDEKSRKEAVEKKGVREERDPENGFRFGTAVPGLEELKKEFFVGKEDVFEQKKISLVKFSSPPMALFKDDKKEK